MRYGYDLTNPTERQMYIEKKQREYKRFNDKSKTFEEKYIDLIKERQEELKFFRERDKAEREIEK